jgi:hypothetical protein
MLTLEMPRFFAEGLESVELLLPTLGFKCFGFGWHFLNIRRDIFWETIKI